MNKEEKKQIRKQAKKDFKRQYNWGAPFWGKTYIKLESEEYLKQDKSSPVFITQHPLPLKEN